MEIYKGIQYWGKKGRKYLGIFFQILPAGRLKHIIEVCMGSGTFSANVSGGFEAARKTAIEIDSGVCALARCIQKRPFEILDRIQNTEYSEDVCRRSIQLLNEVKMGKKVEELELAQAEYAALYMSRNSQRMAPRKLDSYKKQPDEKKAKKSKTDLERQKHNFYRDASKVVWECNKAWKELEIIEDDFMNYPEYWCGGDETLVFADVPYQYADRGISGRKTNDTGYIYDWDDDKHSEFLRFVTQAAAEGQKKSRIIVCASYERDESGKLFKRGLRNTRIELRDDIYNQILLAEGFRMVVIMDKFSSECGRKSLKKKIKAEVVYINYRDILGDWSKFEYYDYEDIFGND